MLEMEVRETWLRVLARGALDEVTDRAIGEQMVAECRHRGLNAALIDIRAMTGRLGVVANFDAAAGFGARVHGVLRRVAIVDLPKHADRSGLFENTAVNRGANVRFFTTIDGAETWLRGG